MPIRCPPRRGSPSWCWRRRCCGCPMPPPPIGSSKTSSLPATGSRTMSNRARCSFRPRPGRSASPPASSIPARPRIRFSKASSNALAFPPCAPPRGRRCGSWARISYSDRRSRKRSSAPACSRRCAIPSTCWVRARARQPTRSAISPPMPMPSMPSPRAPAIWRTVPAFRSSSRPCIRGSRRCRAIVF